MTTWPCLKYHKINVRKTSFRTAFIDGNRNFIQGAVDRNFTKWDDFIGSDVWYEPFPIPQSYTEEIQYMKNWMANRTQWMDNNIAGLCGSVSIGENNLLADQNVVLYPNPTTGIVKIKSEDFVQFQVFDMQGRLILQSDDPEINLQNQNNGVYIVRVLTDQTIITKQIIKY